MSINLQVVESSIYFSVLSCFMAVFCSIFEETCISLDSPVHAEQNGICSTPYTKVSASYDRRTKLV